MRENSELRAVARSQLQGTWLPAVLVTLIYCVIIGASSFVVIGPLVLGGPLTFGLYGYYMKKVRNKSVGLENLFDAFKDGFKVFLPSLLLYLLQSIFIALWSLLFIIPGIIKSLSYSMAFFILRDNPGLDASNAIDRKSVV